MTKPENLCLHSLGHNKNRQYPIRQYAIVWSAMSCEMSYFGLSIFSLAFPSPSITSTHRFVIFQVRYFPPACYMVRHFSVLHFPALCFQRDRHCHIVKAYRTKTGH